jgi:hypothetical protein
VPPPPHYRCDRAHGALRPHCPIRYSALSRTSITFEFVTVHGLCARLSCMPQLAHLALNS